MLSHSNQLVSFVSPPLRSFNVSHLLLPIFTLAWVIQLSNRPTAKREVPNYLCVNTLIRDLDNIPYLFFKWVQNVASRTALTE
jgi:hypothetical protein